MNTHWHLAGRVLHIFLFILETEYRLADILASDIKAVTCI